MDVALNPVDLRAKIRTPRRRGSLNGLVIAALLAVASGTAPALAAAPVAEKEQYLPVPMPPGFGVEVTEVDGPVFVDSRGRTLYQWPLKDLRNGDAGDRKGVATCDDTRYQVNSGLMSPYPPGLLLPELDKRPSCVEVWPPVYAADDSKPIGKWTILERKEGKKQWAFDGYALYSSVLDRERGDVNGGSAFEQANDSPALRRPVGPPSIVPPAFAIKQMRTGRILVNHVGFSVYASDKDGPNKSNCDSGCLREWSPAIAPEAAQPQGEWAVIERSPGIKQWTFRKQPLYTRKADRRSRSLEGGDVPGWRNVYAQRAPAPPKEFTIQDSRLGQVLADSRGSTIYLYNCADDALDQLACDHPDTPQAYRISICGGGSVERCLQTFPYVVASKDAKSDSRIWSVMAIDPKTGHRAAPGQADAVQVWAFRDRPVYTYSGDKEPGDADGDAWGEFNGFRNGFKAFWLRDDFRNNAG